MLRQSIPFIASTHEAFNPSLPTFPVECIAYCDALGLWFPRETNRQQRQQLQQFGWLKPRWRDRHLLYGYRLVVEDLPPSRRELQYLDALAQECGAVVSRVDIALDAQRPTSTEKQALKDCIARRAILNWRKVGSMHDIDGTVYWVAFGRPQRNLALYADKPNRMTGEPNCVHLELRLLSPASVRRAGIHRVSDIVRLNPHELISRYVNWSDMGERYERKVVRRTVQEWRQYYRNRKNLSTWDDQYWDAIPRRVQETLHRCNRDRSQGVRDLRRPRVLHEVDCPLHIPSKLTFKTDTQIIIPDDKSTDRHFLQEKPYISMTPKSR